MLCSPRELAISHEHETGILILPADLTPGADLKQALGLDDAVLDIEVEPNRPDFLSVYGVARETSSILGLPLGEPDTELGGGGRASRRGRDDRAPRSRRMSLLPGEDPSRGLPR